MLENQCSLKIGCLRKPRCSAVGPFKGNICISVIFLMVFLFLLPTIGASATQAEFRLLNPLPQTEDLFGVILGGEITVTVGAHGRILWSRDRLHWEIVASPVETTLNAVTWGHDLFIAVGEDGVILSSRDGASWEICSSPTSEQLRAVGSFPGGFVAVGERGVILFSADAILWVPISTPVEHTLNSLVWSGEAFVAVGDRSTLLKSSDGRVWVHVDLHLEWPLDLSSVTALDGTVLATGPDSRCIFSRDLEHWTFDSTMPYSPNLNLITACHGEFVGPGFSRKLDTLDWLAGSYQRDRPIFRSIACTSKGVIGVGLGGQIAEGDGRAWRLTNSYAAQSFKKVISEGNQLLALTTSGQLFSGTPGMLDPGSIFSGGGYTGSGVGLSDFVFGNGRWLIAGAYIPGCIGFYPWMASSTDLLNWESIDLGGLESEDGRVIAVDFDGRHFYALVAAGAALILGESTDGVNWQMHQPTPGSFSSQCLLASGQRILRGGCDGILLWNSLTQAWNPVWEPEEDTGVGIRSIIHSDDLWVAVGWPGLILTSADGLQWQQQSSGTDSRLTDIAFLDNTYLVIGERGELLKSSDGISWNSLSSEYTGSLAAVTAVEDSFILVGKNGLVLKYMPEPINVSASFSRRPFRAISGEKIMFFNLSGEGNHQSLNWFFGDGSTSTLESPLHVFENEGSYNVSLELTNPYGHAWASEEIEIAARCTIPEDVPQLSCPPSAGSEEYYRVGWQWEGLEGDYFLLEESSLPDFSRTTVFRKEYRQASNFQHPWSDSRDWYYRVSVLRDCPGAQLQGPVSQSCHVGIDPTIDSPGKYVQILPQAIGRLESDGGRWVTDLQLLNPGNEELETILFLLDGDGNRPVEIRIGAHESRHLPDLLSEFQTSREAVGVLIGSSKPLITHAIVRSEGEIDRNGDTESLMGMTVPVIPIDEGIDRDHPLNFSSMADSQKYRVALALTNADRDPVTVGLRYRDASGERRHQESVTLSAWDSKIFEDLSADFEGDDFDIASIRIWTNQFRSHVFAQVFLIDRVSGDPVNTALVSSENPPRIVMSKMDIPPPHLWSSALYAEGRILAMQQGFSAWSSDGLHWESSPLPDASVTPESIGFNGQDYVAVGCGGILLSPDGSAWRSVGLPEGVSCLDSLLWDGRRWLSLSGSDRIFESATGEDWRPLAVSPPLLRARGLYFTGELYLLVDAHGISVSTDAMSWEIVLESRYVREICVGDGMILAGFSDSGFFAVSIDGGRNWASQDHAGYYWNPGGPIIWTGTAFVVNARYSMVSRDGLRWNIQSEETLGGAQLSISVPPFVLGFNADGNLSWINPGSFEVIIPSIAEISGFGGRTWHSTLGVFNSGGGRNVPVDLKYLPQTAPSDAIQPVLLEIPAYATVEYAAPLSDLFSTQGVGSLEVEREDIRVVPSLRISTEGSEGPVAQFIPPQALQESVFSIDPGWILHLEASGQGAEIGVRTNIGVLNTCGEHLRVHLEFFRGDGTPLKILDLSLNPKESLQLNDIFRNYQGPAFSDGFARVTTPDLGRSFLAWASVVRESTSDAIFIPAETTVEN